MTFHDRVRALEGLGFSEPHTRFIVTVALHGGFCLRRHYTEFTGLKYGAGVRDFLDRLVARRLARRSQFRPDRGHVYQIHNSAIYDAIGQSDNRNRRRTSAALIARKLMLFDYVLGTRADEWFVTEQDKVEFFTTKLAVPHWDLPQRAYGGQNSIHRFAHPKTTRYFVHKLPIFTTDEAVTLVYLVTDTSGDGFRQFLQDHVRLLNRLGAWRIVAVAPCHIPGIPACELAIRRFAAEPDQRDGAEIEDLHIYFSLRARLESGDVRFSNDEVNAFHRTRVWFSAPEFDALFDRWKSEGDGALTDTGVGPFREALLTGRGSFDSYRLPLRYDRFGTRPGVS